MPPKKRPGPARKHGAFHMPEFSEIRGPRGQNSPPDGKRYNLSDGKRYSLSDGKRYNLSDGGGTVCRTGAVQSVGRGRYSLSDRGGTVCRTGNGTVCRMEDGTACWTEDGTVCLMGNDTACLMGDVKVCRIWTAHSPCAARLINTDGSAKTACSLAGQQGRGERVFAPARPGRPQAASREKAPAETCRFKNLLATPCQPYAPTMARRASSFFITSAWMTTEVSGPMTSEIGSA